MEPLEKIALESETSKPKTSEKEDKANKLDKPSNSYEGLILIEDKTYNTGTSIKYWM